MALLDFMASPEGQMLDRLGFEGQRVHQGRRHHHVHRQDLDLVRPLLRRRQLDAADAWMSEAAQDLAQAGQDNFNADNAFVWPAGICRRPRRDRERLSLVGRQVHHRRSHDGPVGRLCRRVERRRRRRG